MGKRKTIRLVIDTNVLVSALLFGGKPGKLVGLWKSGRITPCISRDIMTEYLMVLAYPRFDLSENEIEYLIFHEILPYFEMIEVNEKPLIISADPSDDKFPHCASAAGVAFVVSGDHHLLKLKSYKQISIFTVEQLLLKLSK